MKLAVVVIVHNNNNNQFHTCAPCKKVHELFMNIHEMQILPFMNFRKYKFMKKFMNIREMQILLFMNLPVIDSNVGMVI